MSLYAFLADALVLLHLCFILFVVAGAALLFRWPRLVWLHVPAVLWGAYVEFSGRICPLTPIENELRALAGRALYEGDFIGHYVLPVIYPAGLTGQVQLILGTVVVIVNVALYATLIAGMRHEKVAHE